jgi:rSAM/selenodomain-associated transferase 1
LEFLAVILADHLILFSRYPQPGTTKTRLIPHLGETGAAQLQRQMTQQVLRQIWPLLHPAADQATHPISAEIWFSGGEAAQMADWLGPRWALHPQPSGDLGDRLLAAVERAIATGAKRVVVIGADCPSVDSALLQQAFTALQTQDLVLGPATDGGYYLIGLRQPVAELFSGIEWGSERVFAQTQAIAHALGLSIARNPVALWHVGGNRSRWRQSGRHEGDRPAVWRNGRAICPRPRPPDERRSQRCHG